MRADSADIAETTLRTFAFAAASRASEEYPESARKPTVARMARIVITTTSSARVKPESFAEAVRRRTRETAGSVKNRIQRVFLEKCLFMFSKGYDYAQFTVY